MTNVVSIRERDPRVEWCDWLEDWVTTRDESLKQAHIILAMLHGDPSELTAVNAGAGECYECGVTSTFRERYGRFLLCRRCTLTRRKAAQPGHHHKVERWRRSA